MNTLVQVPISGLGAYNHRNSESISQPTWHSLCALHWPLTCKNIWYHWYHKENIRFLTCKQKEKFLNHLGDFNGRAKISMLTVGLQ